MPALPCPCRRPDKLRDMTYTQFWQLVRERKVDKASLRCGGWGWWGGCGWLWVGGMYGQRRRRWIGGLIFLQGA